MPLDLLPDPTGPRRPTADAVPAIRAAFYRLHRPRLLGFATLFTLGDSAVAERATDAALAAALERVDRLRHPERAAAWLRERVVHSVPFQRRPSVDGERTMALLGIGAGATAGLAALGRLERAALLSAFVERIDPRDVGMIVKRDGSGLARLLTRARGAYEEAFAAAPGGRGRPGIAAPRQAAERGT